MSVRDVIQSLSGGGGTAGTGGKFVPVPSVTPVVEPLGPLGPHNYEEFDNRDTPHSGEQVDTPAPGYEVVAIITALTRDAGRDLGHHLANRFREVLAPMGRPERASLAAAIDDAFETAQGVEEARQRASKLLDAHTPRQAHRDDLASRPAWTDWIADRCPLVYEDRAFIWRQLKTLPPRSAEKAARRYVETWQATAATEPRLHVKENRARHAANRTLLALVT